jgi:hypothetical protein
MPKLPAETQTPVAFPYMVKPRNYAINFNFSGFFSHFFFAKLDMAFLAHQSPLTIACVHSFLHLFSQVGGKKGDAEANFQAQFFVFFIFSLKCAGVLWYYEFGSSPIKICAYCFWHAFFATRRERRSCKEGLFVFPVSPVGRSAMFNK